MCTSDETSSVLDNVDLLLAEQREISAARLHFRVVHRFRKQGCDCMPGEETVAVFLLHRSREILVPLSLTLRLVFDFMARNCRLPQSAVQIAAAMNVDPFCRQHGWNAVRSGELTRKMSRAAIKVSVMRIRDGLAQALHQAGLAVSPGSILVSESTATNQVLYRLKAAFQWIHIDDPRDYQHAPVPSELRRAWSGERGVRSSRV